MATDYARNYTATYTTYTNIVVHNIANVNDGNDTTYTYNSYDAPGAGGGTSTLKIIFSQPHNIFRYQVRAQFYDSLGGTYGQYLEIKYRSASDSNIHILYSNNNFNNTSAVWFVYDINDRATELQTSIGTDSNIGIKGVRIYTMSAIGYESSNHIKINYNGNVIPLADSSNTGVSNVRFYDGSIIRALNLSENYAGIPLKINDNGVIKYFVKVE